MTGNGWASLAFLIVAAIGAPAALAQDLDLDLDLDLDSQFERFLAWWPGTYDNAGQGSTSGSTRPTRLILQPVDLPVFGPRVVYGEWQAMSGDAAVLRQRFYSFEIDEARQALRLKLHIFPLDKAFAERTAGAYENPERLTGVTPADMFPLTGCDVFFTWQGDHFAGAMDKGSCAFKAPGTDDDIYSWSQMRLTAVTFEYLDGWFNPDGSVYRVLADDWSIFKRRRDRAWSPAPQAKGLQR